MTLRPTTAPDGYVSIRQFAAEQPCRINKVYTGLRILRRKRTVEATPGRYGLMFYRRPDLLKALKLEEQERYAAHAANIPTSFNTAAPDEQITSGEFAKRHGLDIISVRARITHHGLQTVNDKLNNRDPGIYRAGDLIALLRKYPARKENTAKRKAISAAAKRRPAWVKHPIGTRLRITNVAGRQWTGIFSGYKGDVLATITLGDGAEMVFARDAVVEPVAYSVPLSPCDGFNGKFDNQEHFYKYSFATNRNYDYAAAPRTASDGEMTFKQVVKHWRA